MTAKKNGSVLPEDLVILLCEEEQSAIKSLNQTESGLFSGLMAQNFKGPDFRPKDLLLFDRKSYVRLLRPNFSTVA